jgi:ABC-2 type transport system ATP-binding protein
VEKGQIYGLLGRNGAGKTTLVKILLSIVHATGGRARLLERDVPSVGSRESVGYLPEDHRFPDYHTAGSLLQFLGGLSGMSRAARRARIPELLELVSMREWQHEKIRKYSKGMRQRVGIAQALLHDPQVVFLDEPTDGVDPVGRKQIRDVIVELKSRGKTVFVNSHLLSEVELVSDRVAILDKGRIVREGTVDELTRASNVWEVRIEGPFGAHLEKIRSAFPGVRLIEGGLTAELAGTAELNGLIDLLRSLGLRIVGLAERRFTLEEVFLQAVAP